MENAHFRGEDAAIQFQVAKRQIHRGLSAKNGEMTRVNDSTDGAVHARADGQNHLAAEVDRLGDFGDELITSLSKRSVQAGEEPQLDLSALQQFVGLRASRDCGGSSEKQCDSTKRHNELFHRTLRPLLVLGGLPFDAQGKQVEPVAVTRANDAAARELRLVSLALCARRRLRECAGPDAEVATGRIVLHGAPTCME